MSQNPENIRNIAIIAHVDHGKTTLVDGLLKQSNLFRDNQAEMSQELIMDSGDQERERGITITAKVTAVEWNNYRINIIDTPGHADFSGEVERTLNMADGCVLVVDAQEGPMPQTKFVLKKALESKLKPIIVINKIDKNSSRVAEVEDELADLFLDLAVSEDQLHYHVYYAVARDGKAWKEMPSDFSEEADLSPIYRAIVDEIPAPSVVSDGSFQMLVTALAWDSYKGKYVIGKINRGSVAKSDSVVVCTKDQKLVNSKVDGVFISRGLELVEVGSAVAGDIVRLTGIKDAQIGETIASVSNPEALPVIELEEPTLKMYLGPNTSPFKGTEAEFSTSRQLGDRLKQELEVNVGLRLEDRGIGYLVSGRGELHLSVLIESMRRQGYEFEVGRPEVVTRDVDGVESEPVEEVTIEAPSEHTGTVQTELGSRRATLKHQQLLSDGSTRFTFEITTRASLGLRTILLTKTQGTALMSSLLFGYKPIGQALKQLRNGALVAYETGVTTPYALQMAEARGTVFVEPGVKVFAGQIVGLNKRSDDLEVNVCKAKHLTNMRSTSSDGVVQLSPAVILSLEQAIDFLENDELLEVTPKSLRLRKKELDHTKRKRQNKT
jgi:GTP-binding protein